MKRYFALLLIILNGCAASRELFCVNSADDVCRIPFGAIYSARPLLINKNVSTKGYLINEGAVFFLYPDETSAKYRTYEAGIQLDLPAAFVSEARVLAGKYVEIHGVLREAKLTWATIVPVAAPFEVPVYIGDKFPPAPAPPR